jgi:molecular chaperone DnaK
VNVHAKDLGTNKEQSIRITASSGLTEEEIKRMVREAESHAEEDKRKRAVVEARNKLDNLVYTTEKSLKEYSSDVEASAKQSIEEALAAAKSKLESQDPDELNAAAESLANASHKLAEAMYSKTRAQQSPGDAASGAGPTDGGGDGENKKEDVVDADYREVKE